MILPLFIKHVYVYMCVAEGVGGGRTLSNKSVDENILEPKDLFQMGGEMIRKL